MSIHFCGECDKMGASQDTVELCPRCVMKIVETGKVPEGVVTWAKEMILDYERYEREARRSTRKRRTR